MLNECAVYFSCASNSVKCTIHCKAAEDDGGVGRSVISQAKKKATLTSFRIRDVPRLKLDLDHMKL